MLFLILSLLSLCNGFFYPNLKSNSKTYSSSNELRSKSKFSEYEAINIAATNKNRPISSLLDQMLLAVNDKNKFKEIQTSVDHSLVNSNA